MQQNMYSILLKIDELEQKQHILERYKVDIEANRNFTYTVEEPMVTQIDISAWSGDSCDQLLTVQFYMP